MQASTGADAIGGSTASGGAQGAPGTGGPLAPLLAGGLEAPRARAAVVALITLAWLALGLFELLRSGAAHDILEYDDGVWFGSSLRLVQGAIPYRDFVLDQPPGVPLLLTPIALTSKAIGTSGAFVAARYLTVVVEAFNVALVGWLLRHRSLFAVAVGCSLAAFYPSAVITSRTVMIEPYCALFCLGALAVVFREGRLARERRSIMVAGILFGIAGSCKAFALFPFVVLLGQLCIGGEKGDRASGTRLAAMCAGAAGATFAIICSPFFIAAPSGFVRQVVVAQLQRGTSAMADKWDRAAQLLGVPPAPSGGRLPNTTDMAVIVIAGFVVIAALAAAWWPTRPSEGPARLSLARYSVACTLATAAGLVWPAAFYYHYPAFLGPFAALAIAMGAERAWGFGPSTRAPSAAPPGTAPESGEQLPIAGFWRPWSAATIAFALLVAGTVHGVRVVQTVAQPERPQSALVERAVPPGACTTSDNPAFLILADRFTAPPTCTDLVDAYGSTLSWAHGASGPAAARRPAAVAAWTNVLRHTDYLVISLGLKPGRVPWGPVLRSYLAHHFRLVARGPGVSVYARRPTTKAHG